MRNDVLRSLEDRWSFRHDHDEGQRVERVTSVSS